jgi:hypothetical protein
MLGATYLALSKTSEAKWFYIQEQMLARILGNRELLARSYIGLGNVKTQIGDFGLAQGDFNAALPLAGGSNALLSELNKGLGDLYSKTGKNDLAGRCYAEARRYAGLGQAVAGRNAGIARRVAMLYNRPVPGLARKPAVTIKVIPVKFSYIILSVIFVSFVTVIILFFRLRRKKGEHFKKKRFKDNP